MKIFKLLSVLMFVALSAGFVSCSNDDDDVNADALLGTWQATHTEGWYENAKYPDENSKWNGSWAEFEEDSELPSLITFSKDGKGTLKYNTEATPFTWGIDGKALSFTITDGNDSETIQVTIVSQTDTQVVVEFSFKEGNHSQYEKTTYTKK